MKTTLLYTHCYPIVGQYKTPLHTSKIKSNSITNQQNSPRNPLIYQPLINSMADIISDVFDENEDLRALIVLSDDECAEELQFQEVLAASLEIFHLHMSSTEIQESPESSQGFCDICMETKPTNEMFKLENCSDHSFCSDCIAQYVQSKIQDRIFPVTCPGLKCRAIIEPVSCKSIIPENVYEKWEGGLSESTLLDCEKFYCPYKDCSELLIYDQNQDIIECICPVCQRLFCALCGVPWHTGLDCDKFQKDEKNREDDLKVEELANNSKWMNCPHCKNLVQKADGCIHITCWCGSEFCYVCGDAWSESHWNCQIGE